MQKTISQIFSTADIYGFIADTWNFVLETGASADDYIRDPNYPADAHF
jgi:hypothetical protein